MNSDTSVSTFRYMTYNLCNIPQMDTDQAWVGLRFPDRLDKIIEVIKTLSPDILGLQEVRDYANGSVMADLWGRLGPLGYRLKFQEGSPDKFAVYNVIAYKVSKVWPTACYVWWNSDTPDTVSCSYGNGWPRAILAMEFLPVTSLNVVRYQQDTRKKVSFSRPTPDLLGPAILVVNSHLGLGRGTSHPQEKVFSNQTTIKQIDTITQKNPKVVAVVSLGDHNAFEDGPFYQDEMDVYKKNGFTDVVTAAPLTNENGVPVSGTFVGYTPDPFVSSGKCPKNEFAGKLSRIKYRESNSNVNYDVKTTRCFVSTLTGDRTLDDRKVKSEAELLEMNGVSLRDQYPSDHLPVIFDLEVRRVIAKKRIIKKPKTIGTIAVFTTVVGITAYCLTRIFSNSRKS